VVEAFETKINAAQS